MKCGRCVLVAAILVSLCQACSWSVGHFHQVTALRGKTVGKDLGFLQFEWFRQAFAVSNATLILREYGYPAKMESLRVAGVVKTDSRGNFDFGPIPKGHYFLEIRLKESEDIWDLYEVEVTDMVRATKSITIDVSPFHPDCKGGHEFIETKS